MCPNPLMEKPEMTNPDTPNPGAAKPHANAWDRVERLLGKNALEQLAEKTVAVVGLGSGGGFVALALAMSGVGSFVLIDDDIIEPTNIVRHVADRRHLNQPKTAAVADLILHRNPNARVTTIVGKLETNVEALDNVDLVVVGVDNEPVKYVINRLCRERDLTAIYAGVYERGEGGDVCLIGPNTDGPCYACWAAQLRDDTPPAGSAPELDYGMIGPSGTIEAEPGLWLHVTHIAGVQADMALNALLVGQPMHKTFPANTVILANTAMEIFDGVVTPPYNAAWVQIERDPACLVCGDAVSSEALSLFALAGDLAGELDADADADADSAGEPNADAADRPTDPA